MPMNDDGFLRAILDDPTADGPRLVYADWLDERGDPVSASKAEFLRLTVGPAAGTGPEARPQRLQELAAGLDTGWLAVVSRMPIENCGGKRAEPEGRRVRPIVFNYLCDRRWDELRPTDDRGVRFCGGCRENVHYCDTIIEARRHAWGGHCIAVDLGVLRRDHDLEQAGMMLGRATPEQILKWCGRTEVDPVSTEREQRKRKRRRRPRRT
jgi:uncharacterized protein (TIGR02996 family)